VEDAKDFFEKKVDDVDDDRQPHERQEQREVHLGAATLPVQARCSLTGGGNLPVQEVDARARAAFKFIRR
jgi:hypothetical protein